MPVLSDASARTLARLGFAPTARVVILHADDLGMCLAENQATLEHAASGFAKCGSIMAPCPWAAHIIRAARELPALDLGAHLTLNAEWADYRWSPLTGRDPASGLVDGAGMMWASVADLHAHMDISAARAEMRAQVRYLLAQGVNLTHIDTHMGCILHPALLHTYLDLGFECGLPVMVPRGLLAVLGRYHQPDPALAEGITSALQRAEQADWPIVDSSRNTPGRLPGNTGCAAAWHHAPALPCCCPGPGNSGHRPRSLGAPCGRLPRDA